MNRSRSVIGIIISILFLIICFSSQGRIILSLPDTQKMVVGEKNTIDINLPETQFEMKILGASQSVLAAPQNSPVSIIRNDSGYEISALKPGKVDLQLKLLGYIPVKSISIETMATRRVVPGGHSIGVLLQSKGIMVVGFAPLVNDSGEKIYPARDNGVLIGDLILEVNGQRVKSETDLAQIVDASKSKAMEIKIKRKEKYLTFPVTPQLCPETQRYRIGLYVRDGVVGVGTLTFWDPDSNKYAALGHIILDADTRQGIDVLKGKIVSASIQTIKAGKPGKPGEKIGVFDSSGKIEGSIDKNGSFGIYGETAVDIDNELCNYTMEVGYAHQVKEGKAEIYTVVNGTDIEKFAIQIEKVYPERRNGKGMVIKVTDPRLLSLTGGIIQGMSGSPIIQDSRIIGAVTHVFLNDPQHGYGIFMDQILSEIPEQSKVQSDVS
ncbi:stage iv sporulation protein b [hydrocarbon metagenome]|uniref:Stage iv sporulation protein b n=1 Tax=hydrocarbon metagenome TaxID=938273 RepID=A0A0W8E8P8_9ZZZZ